MFITVLFTGKLFHDLKRLFTTPVLFSWNAIFFRRIFNPLNALEETR